MFWKVILGTKINGTSKYFEYQVYWENSSEEDEELGATDRMLLSLVSH